MELKAQLQQKADEQKAKAKAAKQKYNDLVVQGQQIGEVIEQAAKAFEAFNEAATKAQKEADSASTYWAANYKAKGHARTLPGQFASKDEARDALTRAGVHPINMKPKRVTISKAEGGGSSK